MARTALVMSPSHPPSLGHQMRGGGYCRGGSVRGGWRQVFPYRAVRPSRTEVREVQRQQRPCACSLRRPVYEEGLVSASRTPASTLSQTPSQVHSSPDKNRVQDPRRISRLFRRKIRADRLLIGVRLCGFRPRKQHR